ncbi:MAG: GTPase HflX [Deltaproteobacteria bacterium]|nr:GTPase HflX [Deltaproteobacteria bacterium]
MSELFGNTSGLPPLACKKLERIYRRRVPLDTIATADLIRSLCEASKESARQVGALVHRSGQVDYVVVGDATHLMLPDIGRLRVASGRFRGLRLIHTHLHGEALSNDDLVDLVRLRLDMVATLQLNPAGDPRAVSYAYNVPSQLPDPPYRVVGPVHPSRLDEDFGQLMSALEGEFARRARTHEVDSVEGRAFLIQVGDKRRKDQLARLDTSMRELRELARTAGVGVVDVITQVRDGVDPKYVMGRGKLDELIVRAIGLDVGLMIFDNNLTPTQASNIARQTDLKIIDRTQLILDIFAQRAQSRDGKLQVELAQLKYALPRLSQKDDSLSRLTGGIGGRGPGETKLEIGRRRARERVSNLEAQLKKLAEQRKQRRRRRHRSEVPVVAIVGYTNAGKSTLLNTLTNAGVLAEDKLFATLDPRSRRLRFPEEREVVITDTVGLIRDMPRDLFAAFRATFEEASDADLILHVVDASDEDRTQHIATTETMLSDLSLMHVPRILVFNKADLVTPGDAARLVLGQSNTLALCATDRESTRPLLALMAEVLAGRWEESALTPSYDEGSVSEDMVDGESMATLDELLAATGRRKSRAASI